MHRAFPLVVLVVLAASAACSAAGQEPATRPWRAVVGVEEGYTDNVRWATDGPDKEGAFFTTLEGSLAWSNDRVSYFPSEAVVGIRGRVYYEFSERDFFELFTRLDRDIGRNTVLLRYNYVPNRRILQDDDDGNDVTTSDHQLEVGVEHKFGKQKRLRVRLLFEAEWEDSNDNDRDSFTPASVAELRYRIHELFAPRVDVSYGVRDSALANYDRDELEVGAGVDSKLRRDTELGLRYKRIMRDYTVDSATSASGTNSNFDRDDDADQVEVRLTVHIGALDGLSVEAGYRLRDNQSTRDSRSFEAHEGRLGLNYTFP